MYMNAEQAKKKTAQQLVVNTWRILFVILGVAETDVVQIVG